MVPSIVRWLKTCCQHHRPDQIWTQLFRLDVPSSSSATPLYLLLFLTQLEVPDSEPVHQCGSNMQMWKVETCIQIRIEEMAAANMETTHYCWECSRNYCGYYYSASHLSTIFKSTSTVLCFSKVKTTVPRTGTQQQDELMTSY